MSKRDACTANVINVTVAFYITGVLLTIVTNIILYNLYGLYLNSDNISYIYKSLFFDEEEQE